MRILLSLLFVASPLALAQPPGPQLDQALDTGAAEEPQPVSHGQCPSTVLRNGVQLPRAPGLYKRWHPEKAWGTQELVDMLTSAGEELAWLMPHADPFVVGDISFERGGFLEGHRSHRGGMDVDVGLYWGNGRQHLHGFMEVAPYELDAEANWRFIRAMLDTGNVERILLDRKLIEVIRKWTIVNGELDSEEADAIFPPSGTQQIWNYEGVVHHAVNHKHHMHVRVRCPDE